MAILKTVSAAAKKSFLLEVMVKCEKKIIDIEIEIRLLERRKFGASDDSLMGLENQIRNDKDLIKFFSEKIEVCEEELKKFEKDGAGTPKS